MKKQLMTIAFGALLISGAAMATGSPYQQGDQGHGNRNDQRAYVQHNQGHKQGWYKKGGRMPSQYCGSRYVVTDWRARHLRQPPRGYHWVRSDNGDFLLVAITTGVISSTATVAKRWPESGHDSVPVRASRGTTERTTSARDDHQTPDSKGDSHAAAPSGTVGQTQEKLHQLGLEPRTR